MTGLIVASLAFLVASAVTLGTGWVTASSVLIWCSIVASAATAITLAVAYSRSKAEAAAVSRTARSGRGGAAARGARDSEVVAIPSSRKYHRPDCRYAKVKGAVKMDRAAARRRFDPCGICRP